MSCDGLAGKTPKGYTSPSLIPIKVRPNSFPIRLPGIIMDCESPHDQIVESSQTRVQSLDTFAQSPVSSNILIADNIVDSDNNTPIQTLTFPRTRIRSATKVTQELPVNEDDEATSVSRITEWVDTARISTENLKINVTDDVESFSKTIKNPTQAQGERSSISDSGTGSTTVQIQSSSNIQPHHPMEPIIRPIEPNTSTCTSIQVFYKKDNAEDQCAQSEYAEDLDKSLAERSVDSFQPISKSCSSPYSCSLSLSPYAKKTDDEQGMSPLSPKSSDIDKDRVPSFQLVPLLKTPERYDNSQLSVDTPSPRGSNTLSKMTPRTKLFNRTRNTPTYEDRFYKTKALIAKGTGRLSPFSNKFVNYHQSTNNSTQQAVVTKIITETITEYEEEEEDIQDDVAKRNLGKAKIVCKTKDRACIPLKDCPNSRTSFVKEKVTFDVNNNSNQTPNKASSNIECIDSSSRKHSSKIPRIVLRGHGDPVLLPASSECVNTVDSPETSYETKSSKVCTTPHCKNCKATKQLLQESEENIRYLQHLLAETQEALCSKTAFLNSHAMNKPSVSQSVGCQCCYRNDSEPLDKCTSVTNLHDTQDGASQSMSFHDSRCFGTPSILNPLVAKQNADKTKENCDIPKFDFNQFFQTHLKHTFSEAYTRDTEGPFQLSRLLRVSIAARDSLCAEIRHKFKYGNHILRQRYDILMSKESATPAENQTVLDSYRRFVRFMFHYFDESLKEFKEFDEMCMTDKNNSDEGKKLRYFHEAAMLVDGKPRLGVFVPSDKLVVDK